MDKEIKSDIVEIFAKRAWPVDGSVVYNCKTKDGVIKTEKNTTN